MRFLALLLLAPALASAQQLFPTDDLYCGATQAGTKLLSVRVSLLEGKVERKYRDVDLTTIRLGENTVTFTKTTAPVTINGMRIDCEFKVPNAIADRPAGDRWDTRSYTLPAGSVPTVVMELVPREGGGGWLIIRGKETL